MTSIVTVSPARNIFEQLKWKLKTSGSIFSTIIFVHIILGFLTSDGTGSFHTGGTFLSMTVRTYTLDGAFLYSTMLMLILGWLLASKALTRNQQSIVTNSRTEVMATLLFMVLLAVFNFLSGFFMLCITVALELLKTNETLLVENAVVTPLTAALYIGAMLLAGTIGYFVRATFQFSKILIAVIAVLLFLVVRTYGIRTWGVLFGTTELSIVLRSVLYIVVLWGITIVLRQLQEVSRA